MDKRIAVCRAHVLPAYSGQNAQLRAKSRLRRLRSAQRCGARLCSLSCIFCQVQEVNCPEGARETTLGCAPTENDQNPFAACGRQTLRGFFDTLKRLLRGAAFYSTCGQLRVLVSFGTFHHPRSGYHSCPLSIFCQTAVCFPFSIVYNFPVYFLPKN